MKHEYKIQFKVDRADTMELPDRLLKKGRYLVSVEPRGTVTVRGNKEGMLYLAEVLARCALGNYQLGFHVHLPRDSRDAGPNTDAKPELTFYSAEDL